MTVKEHGGDKSGSQLYIPPLMRSQTNIGDSVKGANNVFVTKKGPQFKYVPEVGPR
ncbi:hypothetical protein SAMN05216352_10764 [Alteribacillus bidgolensis]|uniref:Uncharacterized protein n=1 Tax=Alteribacillus bidgolensis TaxID=930129 RepID=A0A1G8K4S0_9BACI|nr:hypothetical protein SAMN05216352_10764 [Alteribacillus bidgolensis]